MANFNTTSDCGCGQNMSNRQMTARPYMRTAPQRQMTNIPPMSRTCSDKADPLAGMPVAMAYVPWQFFQETYEPDKALQYGTIFPELNKPFYGKGGCPR